MEHKLQEKNQGLVESTEREIIGRLRNGRKGIFVRSPGRINLIGEHTDYNEGFVLPSAINRSIYLSVAPNDSTEVRLTSLDFNESVSFESGQPVKSRNRWANYLIGVVDQLNKTGREIGGFDCIFAGNIPIGAGMSSSAAIETGLAFALNEIFGLGLDRATLAATAQRAENEFVGVKCGIMDQYANLLSKGDSTIFLDCRTLDYEYVPFASGDLRFVLCDTGVKHNLAFSEYNVRRQQCEVGVEAVKRLNPAVRSLRDVTPDSLEASRGYMDPVIYRRCKYVIEENERVKSARENLLEGDFENFGGLMYASHNGLKNEYEVSCMELDTLVEAASGLPGVLGARMMGGGFGGCTLNLVRAAAVHDFSRHVSELYNKKTGRTPSIYDCSLMPGTGVVGDQIE